MTRQLTVCAPMRLEANRLRRTLGDAVTRTGTGPRRAWRAASGLPAGDAVAVAGIGGGLGTSTRPGDVVVATEVHGPGVRVACSAAPLLADLLTRRGLTVRLGPMLSAPRVANGGLKRELARTGALAVDTESAWLLATVSDRPVACVRVIADNPPTPLLHPRTLRYVRAALARLPVVGDALAEWVAALPDNVEQQPAKEVRAG